MRYFGEVVTEQVLDQRYGAHHTAPYGVEASRRKNIFEDAALERSAMACINHPTAGHPANCKLTHNRERTQVKIRALRDIRNGEELFADYGEDYQFDEDTSHTTRKVK